MSKAQEYLKREFPPHVLAEYQLADEQGNPQGWKYSFKQRIVELMRKHDLTYQEVSVYLGVNPQIIHTWVSKYQSGKLVPTKYEGTFIGKTKTLRRKVFNQKIIQSLQQYIDTEPSLSISQSSFLCQYINTNLNSLYRTFLRDDGDADNIADFLVETMLDQITDPNGPYQMLLSKQQEEADMPLETTVKELNAQMDNIQRLLKDIQQQPFITDPYVTTLYRFNKPASALQALKGVLHAISDSHAPVKLNRYKALAAPLQYSDMYVLPHVRSGALPSTVTRKAEKLFIHQPDHTYLFMSSLLLEYITHCKSRTDVHWDWDIFTYVECPFTVIDCRSQFDAVDTDPMTLFNTSLLSTQDWKFYDTAGIQIVMDVDTSEGATQTAPAPVHGDTRMIDPTNVSTPYDVEAEDTTTHIPPKVIVRPVVATPAETVITPSEESSQFVITYDPSTLFELRENHPPKGVSVSVTDVDGPALLQRIAEAMMVLGIPPYSYLLHFNERKLTITAPGKSYTFRDGMTRDAFAFTESAYEKTLTMTIDCTVDFIMMAMYSMGPDSAYRVFPIAAEDIESLRQCYHREA